MSWGKALLCGWPSKVELEILAGAWHVSAGTNVAVCGPSVSVGVVWSSLGVGANAVAFGLSVEVLELLIKEKRDKWDVTFGVTFGDLVVEGEEQVA